MTKAADAKAIQDRLQCNHCKAVFTGTLAQALRVVYEGRATYCSDVCRKAFLSDKFSKPIPNRGACAGCGNEFFSRREAKFCGISCYTGSKQFTDMLKDSREKAMTPASIAKRATMARRGEGKPCLECGTDVYRKKSAMNRKYCSKACYRAYMAKRFDRHIANPEAINLPQGYDAFLDQEILRCPIDGCDWHGQWLTIHVNQMHGITADEFKRAAGFNRSSAIVSKGLAVDLQDRAKQGVALLPEYWANANQGFPKWKRTTPSNEAKEHRVKARALAGVGPIRICSGCGCEFQQSTPFGKAMYCSKPCRSAHYSKIEKQKRIDRRNAILKG